MLEDFLARKVAVMASDGGAITVLLSREGICWRRVPADIGGGVLLCLAPRRGNDEYINYNN